MSSNILNKIEWYEYNASTRHVIRHELQSMSADTAAGILAAIVSDSALEISAFRIEFDRQGATQGELAVVIAEVFRKAIQAGSRQRTPVEHDVYVECNPIGKQAATAIRTDTESLGLPVADTVHETLLDLKPAAPGEVLSDSSSETAYLQIVDAVQKSLDEAKRHAESKLNQLLADLAGQTFEQQPAELVANLNSCRAELGGVFYRQEGDTTQPIRLLCDLAINQFVIMDIFTNQVIDRTTVFPYNLLVAMPECGVGKVGERLKAILAKLRVLQDDLREKFQECETATGAKAVQAGTSEETAQLFREAETWFGPLEELKPKPVIDVNLRSDHTRVLTAILDPATESPDQASRLLDTIVGDPATREFALSLKRVLGAKLWRVVCPKCSKPSTVGWLDDSSYSTGGRIYFIRMGSGLHAPKTTIPPMQFCKTKTSGD